MGRSSVKREADELIGKRKAEGLQPLVEIIVSKKARVEEEEDDDDDDDDDDDSEESGEEQWQKDAAGQMAAEAQEEARQAEEEAKVAEEEAKREEELKKKAAAKGSSTLNMPDRVDLLLDEAKALFKVDTTFSHILRISNHVAA